MKKNIIALACALAIVSGGSVVWASENTAKMTASESPKVEVNLEMSEQNYKDYFDMSSELITKLDHLKKNGYTLDKKSYADFISKCENYIQSNPNLQSTDIISNLTAKLKGQFLFKLPTNDAIDFSNIEYKESIKSADKNLEQAILKDIFGDAKYDPTKDGAINYYYQKLDINGDGKTETLAYVYGSMVSGTGGDNLYIFDEKDGKYTLKTHISTVQKPILVAKNKSNDWNDLIIPVYGGGIEGFYSHIKHSDTNYPTSPSVENELSDRADLSNSIAIFPEIWDFDKGIEIK